MQELWAFILRLNEAVRSKKVSAVSINAVSEAVREMVAVLDELQKWAEEIKPVEPAGRFGNKAFRTWHARLTERAISLVHGVVAARQVGTAEGGADTRSAMNNEAVCEEVGAYLCNSFGDATRIDYGSGHEAMFAVVLYALCTCGVFSEGDHAALVLLVFRRYLSVTRTLQIKFMLEPAGSHGVWGLDDYSFLPFLWGSAQLVTSQRITPLVVSDKEGLEEHRNEFLYIDAIAFIREMKTGNFFEHSPMLDDISRVSGGWPKINQGMIRMYRGEVWEKRVVIQHFLFGELFRFDSSAAAAASSNCTVGSSGAKAAVATETEVEMGEEAEGEGEEEASRDVDMTNEGKMMNERNASQDLTNVTSTSSVS